MKNKTSMTDYAKTGLKLLLLNFIAGIIVWLIAMFLGLSFLTLFTDSSGLGALIFWVFVIFIILFVNGWLAQKIWGWE